jgi:hypothetical protein
VCRGQVEEVVAKQVVNGLADLLHNRPSLMMQYSKQVFDILVQDHHQHMRLHVTQIVIKMVLNGVLRFKEGVGKLIFLLVDTDAQVHLSLYHDLFTPGHTLITLTNVPVGSRGHAVSILNVCCFDASTCAPVTRKRTQVILPMFQVWHPAGAT